MRLISRLYLLLFPCLLVFGDLCAQQTDTTRPPTQQPARTQDTGAVAPATIVRHDSAVRHLTRRDSVRHDSIARVRRAIRDSLRAVKNAQKATADSAALVKKLLDSSAETRKTAATAIPITSMPPDSTTVAASRIAVPPPRIIHPAPAAMEFWQKVLADNPAFNFTGKPAVDIFGLHRPNSKDNLFYLLVCILFYFALTRIFFEKYFNNLMTLFFRVSLRQQQIREQVLQAPLPSLLLNILFVVSGGLYACFLLHYSRIGESLSFWMLYLYCMLTLAGIYLTKFMVLKFLGWVFSISRATDIYIFVVFLVNKMLGIFLLPFLILITFSGEQGREIFITISLAMVFMLWAYRTLAGYRPVRNEIKLTPFYFFLYLCAFEIAPLLLIYKVLLTYLEKVY
jgi:uncharacterized protein DUF4271